MEKLYKITFFDSLNKKQLHVFYRFSDGTWNKTFRSPLSAENREMKKYILPLVGIELTTTFKIRCFPTTPRRTHVFNFLFSFINIK